MPFFAGPISNTDIDSNYFATSQALSNEFGVGNAFVCGLDAKGLLSQNAVGGSLSSLTTLIPYNYKLTTVAVGTNASWFNINRYISGTFDDSPHCSGEQSQGGAHAANTSTITVVGLSARWKLPDLGLNHGIYINTQQQVGTAGQGTRGQLGSGATTARSSPVAITSFTTSSNFVDCAAGSEFSAAVDGNGVGWMWGGNSFGQLGDNTALDKSSPVTVVGGITWKQIRCGAFYHSTGLSTSGILYAWGYNASGSLGDNTTTNKSSPVTVVGNLRWKSLASMPGNADNGGVAGAISTNGALYTWGNNSLGQLGDGTTVSKSSPVSVLGGITNWKKACIGGSFGVGLTTDGRIWTWGYNISGQLGDGTTVSKSSPINPLGTAGNFFTSIDADYRHWAALGSAAFY